MFDFVPSKDPINGNETLRRARRHISFLRIWNKVSRQPQLSIYIYIYISQVFATIWN